MIYNGKALVPIITTDVQGLPKKMLVWDSNCNYAEERIVIALVKDKFDVIYAIAQCESMTGICVWHYCAEIPKVRVVTNSELSQWLAKGNGEVRLASEQHLDVYTHWNYDYKDANKTVTSPILVKKFEDTEWHEPTVDYLGIQ